MRASLGDWWLHRQVPLFATIESAAMNLFIACLLIYGFDLHWSLYFIAAAIAAFEQRALLALTETLMRTYFRREKGRHGTSRS